MPESANGRFELSLAPGAGAEFGSPGDLDRYLGAVAAAGFASVSLGKNQIAGDPSGAARLLADHGLRCPDVISLQVTRHEEPTLEEARELARIAEALGSRHILSLVYARVTDQVVDLYGRCADLAHEHGARLALEMPPFGELNSIGAATSFLDAVGRGRASLMVDTFHFSRGASTWEDLETLPLDVLGYVQFDDALPAVTDDVMHETMDRRAFPGEGEFELERFASTLQRRGWSGLVSVEVLSEELRKLDTAEFARRAYASTAPFWGADA
jgi:sugar phosphate isomerase/epimerase